MIIIDPVFYAIAVPVVLLTGISKTGVLPGLFGGMAVPLFSLVIPPAQAAALMLPILCFIDLFGLRAFTGVYDRRNMPILLTSWRRGVVWSSVSALTSFVAHAGGPPIMAYLLPQTLDRGIYVGTTVWFFFFCNYAKIVPYAYLGQLDLANLATALVLLPLVPIGVWLGVVVQGKLNEALFYQISYWSMLVIGAKLLYDGLRGLAG